jgi:HK97 family phage portal protein
MTTYATPRGLKFLPASPTPGGWPATGSLDIGWNRRGALDLVGGATAGYEQLYRDQPWVWTIINKLARGISRLPAKTYVRRADDSRERTRDTPYGALMLRPCAPELDGHPPTQGWSQQQYIEAIVGSVALWGNAVALKKRDDVGGPPAGLMPLDWRGMTPYGPRYGPVKYWRYRPLGLADEQAIVILPEDIVHYRWWGADGPLGVSPLEPLARTMQAEDAARRAAVSTFSNGARPAGALTTEAELEPEARADLKKEIANAYSGSDNWSRVLLLDGGLKWSSFSHTAVEAQTIEHRKLNREEVCAVYDMPPPVVQILDRATFSNINEQHKMLYQDTFGPWLSMIEGTHEEQLVADEPAFAGEYMEFDLSEVLRADLPARADAYSKLLAIYTPNELRAMENKPRIDDPRADALYLPLNLQPIGEGLAPAVAEPPSAAQVASLLSVLGLDPRGTPVHNGS